MEISLLTDSASVAPIHGLGFPKSTTGGAFQIAAASIFTVDAVLPPQVKSSHVKTIPRRQVRKTRRTRRRKSLVGAGGPEDGGEEGWFAFFSDGGEIGGGSFGGGGGGSRGGGRGWNFDRFGGSNWEEFSSSLADPAFDVVYEVISWIALSNCLHFALKKVVRIVADGIGDREKVAPIC